jgi:hypothetical protein
LALVRQTIEHLGKEEAFLLVDELDIHLLAKDKFQRMLEGSYTTSALTMLTEQLVFHLIWQMEIALLQ